MRAKVMSFKKEEEAIFACCELTRQSIHSAYHFDGNSFVLFTSELLRELALSIIANSEALMCLRQDLKKTKNKKVA